MKVGDIVYDCDYPKTYRNLVVLGWIGREVVLTKKGNLKKKVGLTCDARLYTWNPARLWISGHIELNNAMKKAAKEAIDDLKLLRR